MANLDIDDLKRRMWAVLQWVRGALRSLAPVCLIFLSFVIVYVIGRYDLDTWLLLIACPLAGAAIGLAQDRAEARAKSEWNERFLRLIETDHCISVEITHKHAVSVSRTEH